MKSYTTERFRKSYSRLPQSIQDQAQEAYQIFKKDPYHPSLNFKRVHSREPIYSARVSLDYRVVGVLTKQDIVWFWIGSHSDYDKLLKRI